MTFQDQTFVGRITATPDFSYLPNNGQAVCNFNLAVDDGYFDQQQNQWVDRTLFVRFTAWGKTAESINQYRDKGDLVLIKCKESARYTDNGQGQLTCNGPQTWQDQQQNWRASFEKTVLTLKLLSKGPNNQKSGQASTGGAPQATDDDDIPF